MLPQLDTFLTCILVSGILLVSAAVAEAIVEWLVTILFSDGAVADRANSSDSTVAAALAKSSMMRVLRRTS